MEDSDPPYLVISTADGHSNGGIRAPMPPEAPPFWLVYFATDDIEATAGRVSELGGNILAPPMDIGIAKIAVVQDPQGAVFALYDGRLDD
jgi:predicted enzyme related to lactoylglutathione lyase